MAQGSRLRIGTCIECDMVQVTVIASGDGMHQKEIFTEVLIDRSTMESLAPKSGTCKKKDNRTLKVFSAILSGIRKYRFALLHVHVSLWVHARVHAYREFSPEQQALSDAEVTSFDINSHLNGEQRLSIITLSVFTIRPS